MKTFQTDAEIAAGGLLILRELPFAAGEPWVITQGFFNDFLSGFHHGPPFFWRYSIKFILKLLYWVVDRLAERDSHQQA